MNKKLLYTLLGGALLVSSPLSAQTINNQHKGKGTLEKVLSNVTISEKPSKTFQMAPMASAEKMTLKASAVKAGAQYFTPPIGTTFGNKDEFDLFTVIDANNDAVDQGTFMKETWTYADNAVQLYADKNKADDWFISPAIALYAGYSYVVEYTVHHSAAGKHKLAINWGAAPAVEYMTETALPETVVPAGSDQVLRAIISPKKSAYYYIGLHATSEAGANSLYLDKFTCGSAVKSTAPASVTISSITPDPTAKLEATIKFVAPTTTANGQPLTDLKGVRISRSGQDVADCTDVKPGEEYTYVDNTMSKAGMCYYYITAYNDEGSSARAAGHTWVGLDIPENVGTQPILSIPSEGKLNLSWDAFGPANGGVIFPEDIVYNVYDIIVSDNRMFLGDLKASVKGATSLTYDVATEEGPQQYLYQALKGTNDSGSSAAIVSTPVLVGKPYSLPVREDYTGGNINYFWSYNISDKGGNNNPAVGVSMVGAEDEYQMCFSSTMGNFATMMSGKIDIKGCDNPTLTFCLKSDATAGTFSPYVQTIDGVCVYLDEIAMTATSEGWIKYIYDLNACLGANWIQKQKWVQFGFRFADLGSTIEQKVYLDDISIADQKAVDLAATLVNVPETIEKGQSRTASVRVRNYGSQAVDSYVLKITIGDKEVLNETKNSKLASFGTHTYPLEINPSILEQADQTTVKVEVIAADDALADNNVASADVQFTSPDLLPATNLAVTKTASAQTLAWKAPASVRTIVDNFEQETSWATSGIGNWTMVDVDGGLCGGLYNSIPYGSEGTAFAFTVFNPYNYDGYDITSDVPSTKPKSGNKSLAAFYGLNADKNMIVPSDNWLISPELSEQEQEISFWANNLYVVDENGESVYPEYFDILYSTTDTNTESFVQIGDTYTQESGTWSEYKAQLPDGAKYFAIHHKAGAKQNYLFMIDDVTYTTKNLKVLKYNIYRDGTLLASTTAPTYADYSAGKADHLYQVTTVYEGNLESLPVTVKDGTSGIVTINGQGTNAVQGFYTIDGKKLLQPVKGINLVKMQDGSVKKIFKK